MERPRSVGRVVAGLVSEFMREAAVLVAVFVPLDWAVEEKPLTVGFLLAIIVFVAVFMTVAVVIEVKTS